MAPLLELPRYGFRVGGEDRRLDTVYYVGRRPSLPRSSDNRLPRLITVRSATAAVSGTHLEIRQEGDSVVVTDLGSTNGTTVTSPNGKKERMRRGASLTVVPGTRVDIGDGNIIEILPVSGH
jgi:pSer/pThr/pTyr-binding forkhead associated (FHA) protein